MRICISQEPGGRSIITAGTRINDESSSAIISKASAEESPLYQELAKV